MNCTLERTWKINFDQIPKKSSRKRPHSIRVIVRRFGASQQYVIAVRSSARQLRRVFFDLRENIHDVLHILLRA
jgi:hypothetical protein